VINESGLHLCERILRCIVREYRKITLRFESDWKREITDFYERSYIYYLHHRVIQKAFKNGNMSSAQILIKDEIEFKKRYNRDYIEFVRKLQMDKYMLKKPKDRKPVNCEMVSYKFIRSEKKDMEKIVN
jgi:hypothetical protein